MTNFPNVKEALKYLQRGDAAKIAKRVKCSERTVTRIINGETDNPDPLVVLAILEQAKENKPMMDRINELSKQLQSGKKKTEAIAD